MNYNMTKRLFTKSRGINEITKKLIKNSNFTGEIENIDYYFGYHGNKSINKDIYYSGGSYFNREKTLAIAAAQQQQISHNYYFNFEYDFFNSSIKCESEFAKNYRNQVLSICMNENLLNDPAVLRYYIPEAIEKAKKYRSIKVGAYSCAKGVESIRKNIANFISLRDNYEANAEDIFLTYGGIDAYHHIIGSIFNNGDEIIMPSPCYPVYLAFNKSMHLRNIFYQYNSNGIDLQNLHYNLNNNFNGSETKGEERPKAMVVINPNNPTGRILTRKEMEEIIVFCVENKLTLIASEVLQNLVHEGEFLSFRKVVSEMPHPYNKLELFSTHSASKSNLFNSGARAGYLDLMNIDPHVKGQIYKHISMDICSGIPGQIMMDLTLTPPSLKDGFFSQEFIRRYNESIVMSKNIHKQIVKDFGDQLLTSKLFSFDQPNAGFTFFLNFNLKYLFKKKNNKLLMSSESLCDTYSNKLFKAMNILCTPGNDYGNFPNSIVINLCNHFRQDTISNLLSFNQSFMNHMMDILETE